MKQKTILILLLMLLTLIIPLQVTDAADTDHVVFAYISSSGNCGHCQPWNNDFYSYYANHTDDLSYIDLVIFGMDGRLINEKALEWSGIHDFPYTVFDGGIATIASNQVSQIPTAMSTAQDRTDIRDITASVQATMIGTAKVQLDISITNNDVTPYTLRCRPCITEIESRYQVNGTPYHYGFLDYIDTQTTLLGGATYTTTLYWNGNFHSDAKGNTFGDITVDNTYIVMPVYNQDTGHVDQTAASNVLQGTPKNIAPVAFLSSPETDLVNTTIHMSSAGSFDPDGKIVSYHWNFGDGMISNEQNPNKTYLSTGTYTITLTVTDNEGATNQTTQKITIFDDHDPPIIESVTGTTSGRINIGYSYSITSTDPKGEGVTYTIDWDDGSITTSDPQPSNSTYHVLHTWTSANRYNVSLTVVDIDLKIHTVHQFIYINSLQVGTLGYLTDDTNDGTYDTFHNQTSGNTTTVQHQKDNTYLIDTDGGGRYNILFNPGNGDILPYEPDTINSYIIPLGIVVAISIVLVAILLYRRR